MNDRIDRKVTLLLPVRNAGKETARCLRSVYAGTAVPKVIVLLLSGRKEDGETIRKHFPDAMVFDFGLNPGRAHALNTGFHITQTPYVMTLSPRLTVGKHCVEKLCRALEGGAELAGVQAGVLAAEDPARIRGMGWNFRSDAEPYILGAGQRASVCSRNVRIAAPMIEAAMYRMEALEVTGLLDERFYGKLEDADLGFRAGLAGYEMRCVPGALCREQSAESAGACARQLEIGNRIYLQYKILPEWEQSLRRPLTFVRDRIRALTASEEEAAWIEAAVTRGRMLCYQAEMELMERSELEMSVTKLPLPEEFCMEVPDKRVEKIYPICLGERPAYTAGETAEAARLRAEQVLWGAGDLLRKLRG